MALATRAGGSCDCCLRPLEPGGRIRAVAEVEADTCVDEPVRRTLHQARPAAPRDLSNEQRASKKGGSGRGARARCAREGRARRGAREGREGGRVGVFQRLQQGVGQPVRTSRSSETVKCSSMRHCASTATPLSR